jgi:hypothetical protein
MKVKILSIAMTPVIAFFVPSNIFVPIFSGLVIYCIYDIYEKIKIISTVDKKSNSVGDTHNKIEKDIKTLYQNQHMILSLVNALRVRVNNFYAKKEKNARLKSTGFDVQPDGFDKE